MSFLKGRPIGLRWRSHTWFIVSTVAIGMFTDLFLYGLIVPVFPFMLQDRIGIPQDQIQKYVSALLAVFAGASVLFSIPAGWIADRTSERRVPFLVGLLAILGATVLLAVGQRVWVLVVARILQGTSGAVVWTVGLAMVLDTVGSKNLGKVIGSIFSFISIGQLAAPVLGGVLYDKTGYWGVFTMGAAFLFVDFVMRLLVIEKKAAARYDKTLAEDATNPREHEVRNIDEESDEANEEDTLLPKKEEDAFGIPEGQNKLVRALPILYCLSNPALLVAFLLAFVQATLLATFDATVPTEAQLLFDFDSTRAGLLFIALDVPLLVLGPVAGWAVDKYGTKPASVIGFGYLTASLVLLRLPSAQIIHDQTRNIIFYCGILALNGIGMAIIGSPSIVEASDVVQKYDKANPGFFGENGPYAQLYGFNSLIFSAGLTIGPIMSGALRDAIGYGDMNVAFAVLCGITTILSYIYVGGKPKLLRKNRR